MTNIRHGFPYANLSMDRLMYFASQVFKVETRAFTAGNQELFRKSYRLGDAIHAELKARGWGA